MAEPASGAISLEELQLATRNHGMPLEALRYPVTPVGLHYLLIHYDIPDIDAATWSLRVDGHVDRDLTLSFDEVRDMPSTTRVLTMECAGNGRARMQQRPASQPWLVEAVGTGEWTGVELRHVLERAGLRDSALELVFTGADRGVEGGSKQFYQRSLALTDPVVSSVLLAYELNRAPLPPQHGFPLRVVVPGWYGMGNVKWLSSITAVDRPFTGYQQATAYRMRYAEDEPGEPLTRMATRALMVPPGIPDFFSRERVVDAGECVVEGRAWSGRAVVTSVEVSADRGRTWDPAALDGEPAIGRWIGWRFVWRPRPGEYELWCRATAADGSTQPDRAEWNRGGYANNAVHRVPVRVVGADDRSTGAASVRGDLDVDAHAVGDDVVHR